MLLARWTEFFLSFSPTRPSGPSWSSSRIVCLCVCLCVCLSPFHAIFFEASHWSSDHMTRSRPLIGQTSFPTIVPFPCDLLRGWTGAERASSVDWCDLNLDLDLE